MKTHLRKCLLHISATRFGATSGLPRTHSGRPCPQTPQNFFTGTNQFFHRRGRFFSQVPFCGNPYRTKAKRHFPQTPTKLFTGTSPIFHRYLTDFSQIAPGPLPWARHRFIPQYRRAAASACSYLQTKPGGREFHFPLREFPFPLKLHQSIDLDELSRLTLFSAPNEAGKVPKNVIFEYTQKKSAPAAGQLFGGPA